jgi:hypothetical protein
MKNLPFLAVATIFLAGSGFNLAQADPGTPFFAIVGQTKVLLSLCLSFPCFNIGSVQNLVNTDPTVVTSFQDGSNYKITCLDAGTSALTFTVVWQTPDGPLSVNKAFDITCSLFALPESPIGALAIVGSSLGVLGAFIWLQRHRMRNNNP